MSVQTSELIEAVMRLPPGGKLTMYDVRWDEYQEFLDQLGDSPRVRAGYDNGRLEIVTPSFKHEKYKGLVHDFILVLSDELDRETVSYGSATLKIERKKKGAEADDCFYIQHFSVIANKDSIDLRTDPPPDLVVEIDDTRDSATKLAIYAELGIPEVWCYDGDNVAFWRLMEHGYESASLSQAFPFVGPEHLANFISNCRTTGQKAARRLLRDWVRAAQPHASEG